MYIEKPKQELLNAQQTRQSLEFFIQQLTPAEIAPCQNCHNHVVSSCNSECVDAHKALSTHPEEFPIEPNVTPLVYGLMSTRVAQTCWSCEGHMDGDNKLTNLPRVSFYASAPVYSQLLHRHVSKLKMDKVLVYPWHVVLTDYAQTWAQTYSIVPDLNFVEKDIHLGALQNDLKVIAQDLQEKMKFLAREMIIELDNWIKVNTSNGS